MKSLTSNYTVSCLPPTTPPLNTTIAPKNRTKIITPKWKSSRTDYLGSGLGLNKHPRKTYNTAHLLTSMYTILGLHFIFLFLFLV